MLLVLESWYKGSSAPSVVSEVKKRLTDHWFWLMFCVPSVLAWLEFNVPFQHKYGYIRDDQFACVISLVNTEPIPCPDGSEIVCGKCCLLCLHDLCSPADFIRFLRICVRVLTFPVLDQLHAFFIFLFLFVSLYILCVKYTGPDWHQWRDDFQPHKNLSIGLGWNYIKRAVKRLWLWWLGWN